MDLFPKIAVALVAVGFISVMLLPTLIEGIVPVAVCHWALQNQPPGGASKPASWVHAGNVTDPSEVNKCLLVP
jgi:hypothetical protein